jgi:hypothetical protein
MDNWDLRSRPAILDVVWKAGTEWHELALVTEGDEVRLSVDGCLVARHRSERFAYPVTWWFSFLVPNTAGIDGVEIWRVRRTSAWRTRRGR